VSKKKIIIVVMLLLLVSAVVICFTPARAPQVVGWLAPNDLAEINRIVRHEIWRGTLPDYSWNSFKNLPQNFQARASKRIIKIESYPIGIVKVTISTGKTKQTATLTAAYYELFLQKNGKDWVIFHLMRGFDGPTTGRSGY
jgi:hypothetical protein